ncbi:YrhB domain-containing protein [Amycolatopsis sp., V23-08]|uniref:YrhB domain-containing protein n=1 Tax=Amycolatopsis heterodermiae TaxID=3110235 RepID=A0ABU5R310_9PSEU|nr:YrhB domain-containing protein [Amycolatopsis sp., V23-08]MEA5360245.1 YrhB domain-containing protein [Amycolatopsis sp., V23-08]
MVFQDAFDAAQRFLDRVVRGEHDVEIVINKCDELSSGWAFYYDSRAFVERDDISSALTGNGPLIVLKSGTPPYIGRISDLRDL